MSGRPDDSKRIIQSGRVLKLDFILLFKLYYKYFRSTIKSCTFPIDIASSRSSSVIICSIKTLCSEQYNAALNQAPHLGNTGSGGNGILGA